MTDDAAASEARKHTKVAKPLHRDRFAGLVRALKPRKFGETKVIAGTRYVWAQLVGGRAGWVVDENGE